MDIALSLPIVSYLLSPAAGSWSTSLNFVFFYMTWTTLVLSQPPLRIELVGVLALRLVLWLLPSLLFLAFDTLLPSLAASIKHGRSEASLPPRDAGRIGRLLGLALLNLALETAVEGVASRASAMALSLPLSLPALWPPFGRKKSSSMLWGHMAGTASWWGGAAAPAAPLFRTTAALPLPWQVVKQLAVLLAAREVLGYYTRRNLLAPGARAHADSYGLDRRAPPFSLLVYAEPPVAFLLRRFVPVFLPALALRPHLLTYLVFVAVVTAEETLATSGYTVVPGILMGGIARRTSAYYASGGQGNFGPWGLLDWIHGTGLGGGSLVADFKDEADKHALGSRGDKGSDEFRGQSASPSSSGFLHDTLSSMGKGGSSSRGRKTRKRKPE